MTRLLLLLILLVPSLSWAATVYVDPTCSNNGDGTTTSCASSGGAAGAKNTWVALSMSGGNTYAGKGGASETLASYQIPASGTAGNLITITSYGTGQFTFNSTTTYAVATVSRSYLTFDNVAFQSTATNCLYLTGIGSRITISASTFLTCGPAAGTTAAVAIEGGSDTADLDNLTITTSTFTDIMGWAVKLNDINVGNSSNWDALAITNNTITNAGNGGNTGAISVVITATSTATVTNLSITGNTMTYVGDEDADPTYQIRVIRSANGSAHEDRFKGVTITGNTIAHGGGAIYANHLGVLAGVPNTISSNTISDMNATVGIVIFWSDTVLIDRNSIDGIRTYAAISYLDGGGIDADLGNTRITITRNLITNCLGNVAQPTNSGPGIELFASSNTVVAGNVLVGNKMGIFIGDESAGTPGPYQIVNNTILNSTVSGVHQVLTSNQVHVLKNNLIANNAGYGINNLDEADATLTTNLLYNNTLGNYNSQTAGATDLTSNPLILSNYRTGGNSPARRAGTQSIYCTEYRGRVCWAPPDIGAYQASSGDQPNTRSARP